MNVAARTARFVVRHRQLPQQQTLLQRRYIVRHLSSLSSSSSAVAVHGDSLPAKQIDFSVSAKIEGEESQTATVRLRPGETLRAESGAMLFMTQGVEMNTDLQGASAAFTRMMTGQNVFLTDFTYKGDKGEGEVGLGTDFPSKIVRLTLEDYENSTLICQRGAYLASNPSVNIEMAFTKSLSAGFFGGQGFILQRLSGQGDVLIKAGGTLVEKDLREGETLRVTSGSIVAFTSTIDYDIQMIPGIKNAMFGGEGLFVTTLKGPGKVWLQGMPPDRLIAEIARRIPAGGIGLGVPIGGGGGGGVAEGGETGAEEASAGASPETGQEMVAASDQAIDADRQATVASSGIDADSPSALFGDASPKDSPSSGASPDSSVAEDHAFDKTDFSRETTFSDDETTFTEDSAFSDETSFSQDDSELQQEDIFDETTTTDVFDSDTIEEAGSSARSMLQTLWDLFRGDD